MNILRRFLTTTTKRRWVLLALLLIIGIGAIIAACGKLSDDSERPYTPTGSSGGQTIPVTLPDALGSYSLTLTVDDDEVPADGITYTILHAKVHDSASGTLENFIVTFETTPQSDAIGIFLNPATTPGAGSPSTTTTGRTSANGGVSVRLYGVLSGSCVVQASVDIDGNGTSDLYKTVVVVFTPAGPPGSAGGYRLELTVDPVEIPADGGTASVVTAKLVDSSGGSVENFIITFTEPTLFGFFENEGDTTYEGVTDTKGEVSVRFYGSTAGTALIQAQVTVNDLVGTLQKTEKITVFAVKIPDPALTFDIKDVSLWTLSEEPLDIVILVEDVEGNRIGGIVLGYAFTNRNNCADVSWSKITGTTTTDVTGRAWITDTVSLSGYAHTTCTYTLEAIYEGKLYKSTDYPVAGQTGVGTIFASASAPTLLLPTSVNVSILGGPEPIQACTSPSATGMTVNFTSSNGAVASVTATGTTDATGCTSGVTVTGLAPGNATVTATASGYTSDSSAITVGP